MTLARYVYILERDGLLKIGCSQDPGTRARALRGSLIGCTLGSFREERRLHDYFEPHALGHEWFEDVPGIRAMAAQWGINLPTPPKRQPVECAVYTMAEAIDRLGIDLLEAAEEFRTSASVGGVPAIVIGSRFVRFPRVRIDALSAAAS